MSLTGRLIDGLLGREARATVPTTGSLLAHVTRALRGSGSHIPAVIDADTAMRHDAVLACVRSISKPISVASISVWRGDEFAPVTDGRRATVPPVLRSPADEYDTDRIAWLSGAVESMLLRGMAWGLVRRLDNRGMPAQVELLHPDVVSARRDTSTGPVRYFVEHTEIERWPRGVLWGAALYPPAGSPIGVSAIVHGARAIGLGLTAQAFALDTLGHPHPIGILSTEQQLKNDADSTRAAELKERFKDAVANRDVAVLGAGLGYEPIQLNAEESQFLETIGANVATVCRLFDVRPERIGGAPQGSGSSIDYANLETRLQHHLSEAVAPVARALASSLSTWVPRGQFVRFGLTEQVVLDALTETRVHVARIKGGLETHGEGRAALGRDPIEGIDDDAHVWPPDRISTVSVSVSSDDSDDADALLSGEA